MSHHTELTEVERAGCADLRASDGAIRLISIRSEDNSPFQFNPNLSIIRFIDSEDYGKAETRHLIWKKRVGKAL